MALCYHKEVFTLGIFSAFVVFGIITLFEDAINRWFEEFKKFLRDDIILS